MPAVTADDTELARRATGGDGEAFGLLFDRWLDRAFDVAWHILHDRDAAADAAQDAFAAAWQQIGDLRQPESFGGWLLRITRNKALNQWERRQRSRPVGSEEALVTMDPREAEDPSAPVADSEHGDLVWAASAALGLEDASLLSLHLRHDLGAPELAEELGVKPNAAHQRLFRLKKRLADAIGAWVLWQKGTPSCPDLQAALEQADVSGFDKAAAKAIVGHARGCEACDTSRKLRLSPEALFATMPLVAAGPLLRAKMVAALDGQGVPVPPETAGGQHVAETVGEQLLAETTEVPAVDERPGWADDPSDPDGAGGSGDPGDGDEPPLPATSSSRRRAALMVAATVAVLLLGGLGALTVLADRAGDGTGEQAERSRSGEGAGRRTSGDVADEQKDETLAQATTEVPATMSEDSEDVAVTGPVTTGASDVAERTTTSASSRTTTSAQTAAPQVRFTVTQASVDTCLGLRQARVVFEWDVSGATSAALAQEGGPPDEVPLSGSQRLCAPRGSNWTLTATGPGGTTTRTVTVPTSRLSPQASGDLLTP